eukprot:Sspe_Gene.107266::Locus_85374_Transcript_2_3_Confidence_0.455_Length_1861::g.107266::m.107266
MVAALDSDGSVPPLTPTTDNRPSAPWEKPAVSPTISEALGELRIRLVQIAKWHHTGLVDLLSHYILITRDEIDSLLSRERGARKAVGKREDERGLMCPPRKRDPRPKRFRRSRHREEQISQQATLDETRNCNDDTKTCETLITYSKDDIQLQLTQLSSFDDRVYSKDDHHPSSVDERISPGLPARPPRGPPPVSSRPGQGDLTGSFHTPPSVSHSTINYNYIFESPMEFTPFGVELEVFTTRKTSEILTSLRYKAVSEFIPHLNLFLDGLIDQPLEFVEYNNAKADRAFDKWKVTSDASIQHTTDMIFGFEIISRILKGEKGVAELGSVIEALTSYSCRTNESTAFHVHVSCSHLTNEEIKQFLICCVVFEPVIDTFHDYSRRNDFSRYARSLIKSLSMWRNKDEAVRRLMAVDVSESINPLVQLANPLLSQEPNSGRNHKVNLEHLVDTTQGAGSRRVEFRQHVGCLDIQEVGMWVRFVVLFLNNSAKLTTVPKDTPEALWDIIGDSAIQEYFSSKPEVTKPDNFVYHTRELYSGDTGFW